MKKVYFAMLYTAKSVNYIPLLFSTAAKHSGNFNNSKSESGSKLSAVCTGTLMNFSDKVCLEWLNERSTSTRERGEIK